jgi:chitosanase
MDITRVQEQAAKAIVNIFETSQVLGDYASVTVLAHDKGQLTYGRSQTTLGSGNLAKLIALYCGNAGARFSTRLARWLPALRDRDVALNRDERLKNVLRACADDPVMRDVQDAFFDQFYWAPAAHEAARLGARQPLSIAVVYDSHVHGAWAVVRDRTDKGGAFKADTERDWMRRYVQARREWLATSTNLSLPPTVYRMDTFLRLMDQGYWGLQLPLLVRGEEISTLTLAGTPRGCYDGPEPGTRTLGVQAGLLRGLDARLLQLALSDLGKDILADGVFGRTSATRVAEYQKDKGLPATGVADAALIARALHDAATATA